ncbi:MAG: hypothetical protein JNL97_09405 [Verrucomicrobiales bacterium]|nr:hypothetical protein [Verrucomicrobiales bacterium]
MTSFALEELPPGRTLSMTLRARRDWTEGPASRTNLYRLSSDAGTYFWLPVRATRSDLEAGNPNPSAGAARRGLWVGEATLRTVSRFAASTPTEDREPTADTLALRFLLHVDAAGQVRLLKHATLMRRKRASDAVDPGLVLVVDERRIPEFEGIERRGEARVGQRIETVSYDLPRRSSTNAPPLPPHPLPPDFDRTRLQEEYLASLDLDGVLGPGMTVTTRPGTLVLDPWHRTHPFRHTFHDRHQQGQRIVREMAFRFDAETSADALAETPYGVDVLSGTYTETIEGLTKPGEKIRTSGPFRCRRITEVAALEGF